MIHLYTKYYLNPSNHYWENERKLSLSRVWRTDGRTDGWMDGRRTGRTSPYHNMSRFHRAYKKGLNLKFNYKNKFCPWFWPLFPHKQGPKLQSLVSHIII
jgi:hypothetical protein